jgi:magnesium transporter
MAVDQHPSEEPVTPILSEEPAESEAPDEAGGYKERFLDRRKLRSDSGEVQALAVRIHELLAAGDAETVRELMAEYYPADLADVFSFLQEEEQQKAFSLLDTQEAAEVLDEVDPQTEEHLVDSTAPERLADILEELPADEGADIVGELEAHEAEHVLGLMEKEEADDIRELLKYPKDSAGGIMSTAYVAVPETATQEEALRIFREEVDAEHLFDVYVVNDAGALTGLLDLRRLLTAPSHTRMGDITTEGIVSVPPDFDQEQVAQIFARYDLMSMPVVEPGSHRLIGVITADDVIDVLQEEETEDAMRIAGSDAHELEQRAPAQIALMRLPWIMATMFIELLAGVVIHFFDGTLRTVILLASFMPIISAISGNTGLQSATIIVRGLSTGHIRISEWRHAVVRQVTTTLILGAACGVVLGIIGAVWYGKWTFGLVVCVGMFASVNIAGIVGTAVPMLSKRLGFDPALTAGPFETAFQDVVGISIFLTLATAMLHYLK